MQFWHASAAGVCKTCRCRSFLFLFVLSNACRLSCTGTCASAAPPASAGHQGSLTVNAAGSAAADNPQVQRHLTLYHGVVPLLLELNPDAETTFNAAITELVTRGYLRKVGRASHHCVALNVGQSSCVKTAVGSCCHPAMLRWRVLVPVHVQKCICPLLWPRFSKHSVSCLLRQGFPPDCLTC